MRTLFVSGESFIRNTVGVQALLSDESISPNLHVRDLNMGVCVGTHV